MTDYDPEHIAFLLMADIYHWFGFDSMRVPYIEHGGPKPRLAAQKIIGGPLPETVPTPGYF